MENNKIVTVASYSEEILDNMSFKIESFKNSLFYKQLTHHEKKISSNILFKLSEFILEKYNKKRVDDWNEKEIEITLLEIFPREILADNTFFETIHIVCKKFFEYLYFVEKNYQCKDWLMMLSRIRLDIIKNYEDTMNENPADQMFIDLGRELGLDMSLLSDISKMYDIYVSYERKLNLTTC